MCHGRERASPFTFKSIVLAVTIIVGVAAIVIATGVLALACSWMVPRAFPCATFGFCDRTGVCDAVTQVSHLPNKLRELFRTLSGMYLSVDQFAPSFECTRRVLAPVASRDQPSATALVELDTVASQATALSTKTAESIYQLQSEVLPRCSSALTDIRREALVVAHTSAHTAQFEERFEAFKDTAVAKTEVMIGLLDTSIADVGDLMNRYASFIGQTKRFMTNVEHALLPHFYAYGNDPAVPDALNTAGKVLCYGVSYLTALTLVVSVVIGTMCASLEHAGVSYLEDRHQRLAHEMRAAAVEVEPFLSAMQDAVHNLNVTRDNLRGIRDRMTESKLKVASVRAAALRQFDTTWLAVVLSDLDVAWHAFNDVSLVVNREHVYHSNANAITVETLRRRQCQKQLPQPARMH